MTAIEIIKKSAIILNLEEILSDNSLKNITNENSNDILESNSVLNRMFEILKIMMSDIATDYSPIIKETVFKTDQKKINLTDVENLMKIIQVKKDGVSIKYKIANNCINLGFDGDFVVKYMAYPKLENLNDEVNVFDIKVGEDVFVYGLTALYCLASGLFDEFNIYNQIYSEKLSMIKNLKIIDMPTRRWE
ncbi:MAG: hypothetical protein IJX26_03735 [Clostridia bacterium]|nr:hypothetical protein [Clostridia bacterium]